MKNANEQLIEALDNAAKRFVEEDPGKPNYLYVSRDDGEWDVEFRHNESASPLAMEMIEWTTGDSAATDFARVRSGDASAVASEIASGWDPEWDD